MLQGTGGSQAQKCSLAWANVDLPELFWITCCAQKPHIQLAGTRQGPGLYLDCSAPFCVQTHDRRLYFQGVV